MVIVSTDLFRHQKATVTQCWGNQDASTFCGCLSGAGIGQTDHICPKLGAVPVATAPLNRSLRFTGEKDRLTPGDGKPAQAVAAQQPQWDRKERLCRACAASFSVILSGINAVGNKEKANFFGTKSSTEAAKVSKALQDDINAACEPAMLKIGAMSPRLTKQTCGSVAQHMVQKGNVPRCWATTDATAFCSCIENLKCTSS